MTQGNIKTNKGFTIVELLVVIVVIGILAAISIVSYTGITAKANTAANKQNASSVIATAQIVYANTSSFPVTSATSATVIAALNSSDAKIPSGLTVTSTSVTSGTATALSYRQKANTGICVGYWDYSLATPAQATLSAGNAAAGTAGPYISGGTTYANLVACYYTAS
jgi:type IV pilus assembly protein PilA